MTQGESATRRRYHLLRCIGQGGFGMVYQAEMLTDTGLVRPVALKVYRDTSGGPKEGLARFRDEARLMARVSHRAIVPVLDLVQLPMGWTIVMDWVEGVDVSGLIGDPPVPPRVALSIVSEVADALAAAWDARSDDGSPLRLIHRDIKPSNLRISLRGDIRLLDFGAARGELLRREALTTRWKLGTVPYMAPERIDDGVDSPACDIFSLGLVALDLMRGILRPNVLPRENHLLRYRDLLHTELVEDSGLAVEVIDQVVGLVQRMTAPQADARPTAREVTDEAISLADGMSGPRPTRWLSERARRAVETQVVPAIEDVWAGQIVSQETVTPALPPDAEPPPPPEEDEPPTESSTVGDTDESAFPTPPEPVPTAPVPTAPVPTAPADPVSPPATRRSQDATRPRWLAAIASILLGLSAWYAWAPAPVPARPGPVDPPPPAPGVSVPQTPEAEHPESTPDRPPPPVAPLPKTKLDGIGGRTILEAAPQGSTPSGARQTTKPSQPATASAPPGADIPAPEPDLSKAEGRGEEKRALVGFQPIKPGMTLYARKGPENLRLPARLATGTWELFEGDNTPWGIVKVENSADITLICNEVSTRCVRPQSKSP